MHTRTHNTFEASKIGAQSTLLAAKNGQLRILGILTTHYGDASANTLSRPTRCIDSPRQKKAPNEVECKVGTSATGRLENKSAQ